MKSGAERTVYSDFLPTAPTAIYTFVGQGSGFSRILRMRFCNSTAGVAGCVVFIGAAYDLRYLEMNANLAANGTDRCVLEYAPDSPSTGLKLRNGESIIAYSNIANAVAARIEVEDVTT